MMSEWQDIASAPKDGGLFIAYWPAFAGMQHRIHIAKYKSGIVCIASGSKRALASAPTHWQPLPAPPEAA